MIEFLCAFTLNTWTMVLAMAPYLIVGFGVAGLLHILLRPETVQDWLGKPGFSTVLKACLIGVPLPLCSCSVIPVAAALRNSGASRGATAAFLSSTPQTGIDSILATYALMGGWFSTVRVVIALLCGLVTGALIERFCKDTTKHAAASRPHAIQHPLHRPPQSDRTGSETTSAMSLNRLNGSADLQPQSACIRPTSRGQGWIQALRYGFINLPADLASAVCIGLILAGLIATLLPANLITGSLSAGPLAFLLATVISLPLYTCATASIPMAYALMLAGLSPGAALVFLIIGPATNTTTLVTAWTIIGRRATFIYLGSLLLIAWLAGWLLNASLSGEMLEQGRHCHEAQASALWQQGSGIALLLILLLSPYARRKLEPGACCSGHHA